MPTPAASEYGSSNNGKPRDGYRDEYATKGKPSLSTMARKNLWPTPTVHGNHNAPKEGTDRGFGLSTAVKTWPTPRACDVRGEGAGAAAKRIAKGAGSTLAGAVKIWPTPTVQDSDNDGGPSQFRRKSVPLNAAVKEQWRTPNASDHKNRGNDPEVRKAKGQQVNLSAQAGGSLNPTWVEWLMGYPLEWTVLGSLEMQWFRSKHGRRSPGYAASKPRQDLPKE